jgi:hypothetical protein
MLRSTLNKLKEKEINTKVLEVSEEEKKKKEEIRGKFNDLKTLEENLWKQKKEIELERITKVENSILELEKKVKFFITKIEDRF